MNFSLNAQSYWWFGKFLGKLCWQILKPLSGMSLTSLIWWTYHYINGICYISLVRHNGQVTHIKIQYDGDSYCLIGSPDPFASLSDLIQHYTDTPNSLKEKSGQYIELLYPVRSNDPTTER